MFNELTNEPGIKDAAVQPEKKKERKTAERPDLHAEERHVLAFLRKCTAYQADAVRVIADFADSQRDSKEFSAEDAAFINAFLNDRADRNKVKTAQDMKSHREERADELMDLAEKYFSPSEIRRVMRALSKVADDEAQVRTAFDSFMKPPFKG